MGVNFFMIVIINSILTGILLILFFAYLLNKNSLKNPEITNLEKEEVRKKINRQEIILCFLGFMSAVLFWIESEVAWYIPNSIFTNAIVLIAVISIILKKVVKVKIADKLCVISIAILVLIFFIRPIYWGYYRIWEQGEVSCGMEETAMFNTKFTQYEGTKTGAQVKTLLQEIISSNSNPGNEDRLIFVEFLDEEGNPWTEVSFDKTKFNGSTAIKANEKYIVEFEYTDKGLVNKCIIRKTNKENKENQEYEIIMH